MISSRDVAARGARHGDPVRHAGQEVPEALPMSAPISWRAAGFSVYRRRNRAVVPTRAGDMS
jgi:hypothetical protein